MKITILISLLLSFLSFENRNSPIDYTSENCDIKFNRLELLGPIIESIGGSSSGVFYSNGQWSGNIPGSNCMSNYSGDYVINTDVPMSIYWLIKGKNFGNLKGNGILAISHSAIKFKIINWSDTEIKINVESSYTLDSKKDVAIIVKNTLGQQSNPFKIDVIGMIGDGRGFGQCTWEASYQRRKLNMKISPSAYSLNLKPDKDYVPQIGDLVHFGTNKHTSIILSKPIKTSKFESVTIDKIKYDSIVIYTFNLRERNHNCDESAETTEKIFVKRKDKNASKILVKAGIQSANSKFGFASGIYR
ncbi:MAG: hypothetical protein IPO78_16270 [Saprospiraceae bacterium]|nr:hypothetical protein [Saprospiraceae bacterium]MBK9723141.1 hypothetical protein [Saprospiraceae bacterium]